MIIIKRRIVGRGVNDHKVRKERERQGPRRVNVLPGGNEGRVLVVGRDGLQSEVEGSGPPEIPRVLIRTHWDPQGIDDTGRENRRVERRGKSESPRVSSCLHPSQ